MHMQNQTRHTRLTLKMSPKLEIHRPQVTDMDFLDSSFFTAKPGRRLPAPAEVTARSPGFRTNSRPKPVIFDHLNLIVKFGSLVKAEEALCLHMLRMSFSEKIPVPEVYGWKVEEGRVFIYMELIRGDTLLDKWDHLSDEDRTSICAQLNGIVSVLRQIEQHTAGPFIGMPIHAEKYISATIY